jgi:hypothetical protein
MQVVHKDRDAQVVKRYDAMPQQAPVVMAPAATERLHRVDRWFYISMALLMILFNVVASGPSIINQSGRNVLLPLTPLVTVHAIVAAAWLLVFLTQAMLVASGRTSVHRRFGIVGAWLTVLFVVVGYFTIIEEARRGFNLSGDGGPSGRPDALPDLASVGVLFGLVTFAILAGVGLYYRHRPSVYKRLMGLALLGGLSPTPLAHLLTHWPAFQPRLAVIFPVSFLIFVSASAIYDRVSQGRIHPVSLWGGILIFVSNSLFFGVIQPTAAWREFAAWLIR